MGSIVKVEGRAKPWRVYFYTPEGQRKTKHFAKRIEAEEWVKEFAREHHWKDLKVTSGERMLIAELREACDRSGISVDTAMREAIDKVKAQAPEELPVWEAKERYLTDCERRNLRPTTVEGYRRAIETFISPLEGVVSDITREDLLQWLLKRYSNDTTRHIARRSLLAWLRWCQSHRYTAVDWSRPLTWKETLSDETRVAILQPAPMAKLLHNARPKMQPALALMAFAGIRPDEIAARTTKPVLLWQDIDTHRRIIRIRGEVSKTRRYRELHDLPENLWAWIEKTRPPEQEAGRVLSTRYNGFRSALRHLVGTLDLPPLTKDVLRHSFASYAYHTLGMEHAMEAMGHSNAKTFAKYYKGAASPTLARQWFSILPADAPKQ